MRYENYESEPIKFQNDIYADNAMNKPLNSQIIFTRDASVAEDAAERKAKNPLNIGDVVIYREPVEKKEDSAGEKGDAAISDVPAVQTDGTDIQAEKGKEGGDFYAYTPEQIERKIQKANADLARAQARLEQAMESQVGVISAMMQVSNMEKLLEQYNEMHSKALEAEAKQSANVTLGSVSSAQWKLEQAYKGGKYWEIDQAKSELAREKAKEAANKMK